MQITRDVISDLWPIYSAGEASDATQKVVEEFLATDQEFAELLKRSTELESRHLRTACDEPQHEVAVIQHTRRKLATRELLFGAAIFVSLCPLAAWKTSWGSGWILRDYPVVAVGLLSASVVLWGAYLRLRSSYAANRC